MSEERIPPLPASEWSDEMWAAIEAIGAKRPPAGAPAGPTSNILGIYANNPPLVQGWMKFSSHLKHSSLTSRVREMAIIRTTWLGGGEYEWAQHRKMALGAGLSQVEVDALSDGPEISWSAEDAVVIAVVDEMVLRRNVTNETWRKLAATFGRPVIIDLVFTIATYDMHCLAFNSLGLQLDEGLEGFPAEYPRGGASF